MTSLTGGLEPGDWMQSVAQLLPVPHRGPLPFTLGEAVAELELWARTARAESWGNRGNIETLDRDVEIGLAVIGPRLRAFVEDLMSTLVTSADRRVIVNTAAEFEARWRQPNAIEATFRDLCEAAASASKGTWDLKPMAEILASQLGETNRGLSVLRDASTMLYGEPRLFHLEHWLGQGAGVGDLTPSVRLAAAAKLLMDDEPAGRVVVWLLYRRAQVSWRVSAGPITFLRADWAIPNATRDDGQDFQERDELRALLDNHFSLSEEDLTGEDAAAEQYVLVRVDLGVRSAAGAAEEATRRVDALLNIAIDAGGVSWINTGTYATQVDGRDHQSSFGAAQRRRREEFDDSYGINATGDLLHYWAGRLDAALSAAVMPDFLVEALAAVREAGMINHRDVVFYDARPVTPRVAIALEDHAVELIASLAEMNPEQLITALAEDEVDHHRDQLVLKGLLAPLDRNRRSPDVAKEVETLEHTLARYDSGGTRIVSLDRVWDARDRLRALPVSPAERVTLEHSLAAISSTFDEARVLERARQSSTILRGRHRRVRNAITHGNPVSPAAIDSVRGFSERMARRALHLALHAYATRGTISNLLAASRDARDAARRAMAGGVSAVDRTVTARAADASATQADDSQAGAGPQNLQ